MKTGDEDLDEDDCAMICAFVLHSHCGSLTLYHDLEYAILAPQRLKTSVRTSTDSDNMRHKPWKSIVHAYLDATRRLTRPTATFGRDDTRGKASLVPISNHCGTASNVPAEHPLKFQGRMPLAAWRTTCTTRRSYDKPNFRAANRSFDASVGSDWSGWRRRCLPRLS
jgi:hypothetical protein